MIPRAAIDAAVHAGSGSNPCLDAPGGCTHTDCHYARILTAALPHLLTDEMIERVAKAYHDYDWPDCGWPNDDSSFYREAARLALTAAFQDQQTPTDGASA